MIVLADVISSTIVFAVPLLLVAMGGMFSERSGIINIALEGIMIIGALMGCLMIPCGFVTSRLMYLLLDARARQWPFFRAFFMMTAGSSSMEI